MQSKKAEDWKKACEKEIQSFWENNTYGVVFKKVHIPMSAKVIKS